MKETGLMFKAPLVRSILDGTKTQTRRVVPFRTLQLIEYGSIAGECHELPSSGTLHPNSVDYYNSFCPMGQPGDRIYVRETFCYQWSDERGWLDKCWFRATTPDVEHPDGGEKSPWKPAIHMPKAVARIWLDITGVRLERLQDISEADAKAEGVDAGKYLGLGRAYARVFSELWESTGGDWAANPWVWVIDFKRDLAQKGQ